MKRIVSLGLLLALLLMTVWLIACASEEAPLQGTEAATEHKTATVTASDTAPDDEVVTDAPTEETTETGAEIVTSAPFDTEAATQGLTESDTSEVDPMPVEPLEITERYFIFRIWNFEIQSLAAFKNTVDTVAADGFNAIKVHIPWHHVETTAGVYDYSAFDQLIDYIVREKGMKVAISLDMTRRKGDTVLSEDDIMRDAQGNLCMGGSHTGDRLQISFNSENAVSKCVAFYRDAVAHYDQLYGDSVLFYLPAFSQYAETEYWCAGEYDYSENAVAAFRLFLQDAYATIEALNVALGTSYQSFDAVQPPAAGASDNLGQLWYMFRHQSLKAVIDRLAAAQDAVTQNTKFAIQLGCVYDTASALRGTYGVATLAENADVVWIDDGPLMDHSFSMDYIRSVLPATVELAQEIDGPHQNGATPERYLEQGLTCFERGCTYVSAANWNMDANYETYRPVWQEIASAWLGDSTPAVVQPDENTPTVEIPLSELFRRRSPDRYISEYKKAAPNGEFVYIKVIDDLTGNIPTEPALRYAFPSDFSSEQGVRQWSYCTYQRKKLVPMIYDETNQRWQGAGSFNLIMNGSMHPDAADTALVFTAPENGTVTCSYSLGLASAEGDGVIFYILHNGETVEIGEEKNGGALVTQAQPADGELVLTVAAGDEIAFLINKNGTTSYDSTAVSFTVEYQ